MDNVPERPGEWTGRTPIRSGAHQRVSNAERDAVVEQLRLNMADGRLDIDEYGEPGRIGARRPDRSRVAGCPG